MTLFVFIIFFFYLIPIVKLVHLVLKKLLFRKKVSCFFRDQTTRFRFVRSLVLGLASCEFWLFPFRRYFVTWPLLVFVFLQGVLVPWRSPLVEGRYYVALCVLGFVAILIEHFKIFVDLNALELLKIFPRIHPQDFFRRYSLELAFGGTDILNTQGLSVLSTFAANFRRQIRSSQSWIIPLKCLFDTYYITQMGLSALRRLGRPYFEGAYDTLAILWGKRMLERSRVYLTVTGADRLLDQTGKVIFIFNHKSYLDFATLLCAFSDARLNGRRPQIRFVLPVSICTKHKLVLWLVGLKKIFLQVPLYQVPTDPSESLKLAQVFADRHFDPCFFPQGKRALPNFDRANKRRDAGYFTTLSRSSRLELRAHLCPDVIQTLTDLVTMTRSGDTHDWSSLIVASIKGTALVLPRGGYRIQTECEVQVSIGLVQALTPDLIQGLSGRKTLAGEDLFREKDSVLVQRLSQMIDEQLQGVLGIHQQLTQRYLTELKGQFRLDDHKIDFIKQSLASCLKEGDFVVRLLDCIYALPVASWNPYLSQVSQLFLERAVTARFTTLLDEVMQELLKHQSI